MASINGDWFHSRSSSNIDELKAVRVLVIESQKPQYANLAWSAGRQGNQPLYQLSSVIGVQPSTMQTKIRAIIRYGFVENNNTCPLSWTSLGRLWNELYTVGNYSAAKQIYELTLSISLALYAFNNTQTQFSINPANGDMPLKFLLSSLDSNGSISLHNFSHIVDGSTNRTGTNFSYWKRDLLNSGLFKEENESLVYTGKYVEFIDEMKVFRPNVLLMDIDWEQVRNNPLIDISPFKNSLRKIFESLTQVQNIEDQIIDSIYTNPLVDIISEQEEISLPETDILSTESRFTQSIKRVRNQTWSIRIKKKYKYLCAVPNCDVNGNMFLESAHIKPDNADQDGTPHRSHILNGLSLCRHCHVAFDKGLFALTNNHKILISTKLSEVPDQNLKTAIMSSANDIIKSRIDNRLPLAEFIEYHRKNKFQGC